jgi:cell wall-associated NlpC family hydrolase
MTRADVVAEARAWLGTPWMHQQRRRGVAVDCAGLVIGVARALGLVAPDFDVQGYVRVPDGSLLQRCGQFMARTSQGAMQPGDVLVVAIDGDPCHMGIIGDYRHGGLSLIHAATRAGRVIEHRLMFAGNLRFRAAFTLPGVA